ncbi:phosphatase PAP2 family protein [Ideonella sp. BN130291]|uniref:phosphatase PAP2 family protein n=1 Tax=Ideonella sp. BN130291 TaxID=3112940 RepID=UPI002E255A15|nr:phosphatase PAP2 family protein [Ideonella sp. BN130291]
MRSLGPWARAPWFAPAGVAALLLLAFLGNRLGVDLWLSRAFGGPAGFAWREHWFTAGLLHEGARHLSLAAGAALLLLWLASWLPAWRGRLQPLRAPVGFVLVSAVAAAWAVATLKHRSLHSCPWDLQPFGGMHEFFPLFGTVPADPGPGQCLPSGHASTGFMWTGALYAAARWPGRAPWAPLRGWRGAWFAFAAITSLAQVVRGAHFLSHVLIGVAVCWAVVWLADLGVGVLQAWRRRPAGAAPALAPASLLGLLPVPLPGRALRTARARPARRPARRAARRRPGGAARWP